MRTFRYPLTRLKQVRERECATAADLLRQIQTEIHQVEQRIAEKTASIQQSQQNIVDTETRTGTVRPDLRKLVATFVQSVEQERQQLQDNLALLQHRQHEAHADVLERKQAVKMLENHEDRLATEYLAATRAMQQKEEDELWLSQQRGQ